MISHTHSYIGYCAQAPDPMFSRCPTLPLPHPHFPRKYARVCTRWYPRRDPIFVFLARAFFVNTRACTHCTKHTRRVYRAVHRHSGVITGRGVGCCTRPFALIYILLYSSVKIVISENIESRPAS